MKIKKQHFGLSKYASSDIGVARAFRLSWALARTWEAPAELMQSLRREMRWHAKLAVVEAKSYVSLNMP